LSYINTTPSAAFPGAADLILSPTLNGLEILNLSDFGPDHVGNNPNVPATVGFGGTTISGANFTGETAINNNASQFNVTVTNIDNLTDLGITNSDADLNVSYIAPAGSANNDAKTLTLNGSRDTDTDAADTAGAAVVINTPANGLETLTIASTGSVTNTLEALAHTGTTLATLNVSGTAPFAVRRLVTVDLPNTPAVAGAEIPLPNTLTTINAASASGGVDLTVTGTLNVTFTGGSGSDTINFATGGGYTSGDVLNAGGGTNNVLGLTSADAALATTAQTNADGFQTVLINNQLAANVDVTRFGDSPAVGATDAILDTSALGLNLSDGGARSVTLGSGARTLTLNNDDTGGNVTAVVSGVLSNDTLTVNLNNADLAGTFTAQGAETVTINSGNGPDGTAADVAGAITANTAVNVTLTPSTGTGALNISGPVTFNVTGIITAGQVNAASAGAPFIMETTSATLGVAGGTVTGSPFNDELTGGVGNEGISGGDGNDQIKGNVGSDIVTGGAGTDRFFYDLTTHFGATFATPEVISDLAGGTDKIGLASGIVDFAGVVGTEALPLPLATANFETGRATISALVAGDANKIVRISGEQTSTQIQNDVGAAGAVNLYVLVFDSTLGRGLLVHDANWADNAGRTFTRLESITTNAQLQLLTFTDFEEID
jgi:hypothetical protein